jgi:hypothetical protein
MMNTDQSEDHMTENINDPDHALSLRFSIGYTSSMIGAVHNLTYEEKKVNFL